MNLRSKRCLLVFSSSAIVCSVANASWMVTAINEKDDISFSPYVCFIGSTYYKSISEALKNSKSGDVVEVIPGNTNKKSKPYTISLLPGSTDKTVVIPKGVTLSIPYEKGTANNKKTNVLNGKHALSNRNVYCKSTVILGDGVTLENNGTIEIGGILTAGSGQGSGYTANAYSELLLGKNSTLKNHSLINAYGFLGKRDSTDDSLPKIICEPSKQSDMSAIRPTIYLPMYWYDFCGGSSLKAIYDNIGTKSCLPLDDFYFENIEVPTYIYGGSDVYSWVNLYAANNYAEYDLKLIGSDSSGIIMLPQNSYVISTFDSNTLENALDFYGSTNFSALTIDVEKAIKDTAGALAWAAANFAGIPSKVTSSDGYFPVSYHYQISLNALSGGGDAVFDGASNNYKFLNGSSLKVGEDATFSSNSIVGYDGTDVYTGRQGLAKNLQKSKTPLTPASMLVNGNLSAGLLAGTFETSKTNAKIVAKSETSVTMYEPKNGSGSSTSAAMADGENGWFYVPLNLKLKNASNSYSTCDTGKYVSKENGFFFWDKSVVKDIDGVTIKEKNNSFSTDANKKGIFTLSTVLSPTDFESEIVSYSWKVEKTSTVGGNATLSSSSGDSTILTIPANSNTDSDATYKVSVEVKFKSADDGSEQSVGSSVEFIGTKRDNSCVLPYSQVLMADGSYKNAIDVVPGDVTICFNHETGKFEPNVVMANDHVDVETDDYLVTTLFFEDGNKTSVIYEHGFFDFDLNHYVYISSENADLFVGHHFLRYDGINTTRIKLVGADTKMMHTKICSPETRRHLNVIIDNMLGMPGALKGLFNIFSYDPATLKFDSKDVASSISAFGTLTRNEFDDLYPQTKFIFDLIYADYLKIAIGKGLLSWERFDCYVAKYSKLLESGQRKTNEFHS